MPRFITVACLFLFLISDSYCQVYHFETGKILPISEANQIVWKQGVYNNYPADYGTLIVKENRKNRESRLINIPIIRIKAAKTDSTVVPVFLLNGGPGESNFQPQLFFDELTQYRDVVLIGYRGVDGSTKLDCPCMKNALLGDSINLSNYSQLFKMAVDSCFVLWENKKIDVYGYSMDEVVDDIEITRSILGYKKIDLLAFSYGTMLSQLYNEKYPGKVNSMVLIGARPLNKLLFDGGAYNQQIFNLYKHYPMPGRKFEPDSLIAVLSDVESMLFKIMENSTVLNPYRFLFFGFSKLYTLEDIEKVFISYAITEYDNVKSLNKLYVDFYKNFPGDIVLGDVILKKQGRVNFQDYNIDNTIGYKITNAVNAWYSPEIELLQKPKRVSNVQVSRDSVKVLFISGEFDVASPPQYLSDSTSFNYLNYKSVIINNSGHLDLFYSKNTEVKKAVLDFFN